MACCRIFVSAKNKFLILNLCLHMPLDLGGSHICYWSTQQSAPISISWAFPGARSAFPEHSLVPDQYFLSISWTAVLPTCSCSQCRREESDYVWLCKSIMWGRIHTVMYDQLWYMFWLYGWLLIVDLTVWRNIFLHFQSGRITCCWSRGK